MAQTSLGSVPLISGQDVNTNSSVQTMPLGAYAETADGRGFRYCKVGGTSTVAARIYQSPAEDTSRISPSQLIRSATRLLPRLPQLLSPLMIWRVGHWLLSRQHSVRDGCTRLSRTLRPLVQ